MTSDGTAMGKFERVAQAHPEGDEILALGYAAHTGAVFSGGNEGVIRWAMLKDLKKKVRKDVKGT